MTLADRIAAVRRFNRFYTQKIGVLDEGLLESPFSLTAVRVLYELANRHEPTASDIARDLGLDAGYLSRILRRFQQKRLVEKRESSRDGRSSILRLTPQGLREFRLVNAKTNAQVGGILRALPTADQERLLKALRTIEDLLDGAAPARGTTRRRPRAGAARASTGR